MTTTLVVCLLVVCALILLAMCLKTDVRASFKLPLLTFSLDARGKATRKRVARRRPPS